MSMDAVEFINARDRMIKETGSAPTVEYTHAKSAEEIVTIVEKWAREHPAKTRQSEFLRMFPNVILNNEGQPYICPKTLDTAYHPDGNCALDVDICRRCKAKFWGQEVE